MGRHFMQQMCSRSVNDKPFPKTNPWHPILFYSSAKPHGTGYARFSTFSTRLSERRDLNVQGEPKTLKTELFYTAMASVRVMA
jgi:hypothetical protein